MSVGNNVVPGRRAGGSPVVHLPPRIRHIRIETGAFTMDYRAGAEQIADIVAELRSNTDVVVSVDDDVSPDLPPLPCGGLWE
jgi:hypothetical protein